MSKTQRPIRHCPSCGADTEPLLATTGALGKRLDVIKVGGGGNPLLFKDLRKEPYRLPWRPELSLYAGIAPIVMALFGKMAFAVASSVFVNPYETPAPGGAAFSSAAEQMMDFMPYVFGVWLIMAILAAVFQHWSNARYQARQAWLEQMAKYIDQLRMRAGPLYACSFCTTLHGSGTRMECTHSGVQDALGVNQQDLDDEEVEQQAAP
ncbi:MAG: hypothetical protein E6R08_09050 [Nevskiaceae bacterium]|nr:MAG: hypothetical protein E6R08_09050 [Nevskiaceae bacterium]